MRRKTNKRPDQINGGIDLAVTWGLATVFLISSVPHLGNPYYFLGSINSYGLFGPRIAEATAIVLPVLQLILAVCLLADICREAAHSLAFVLLVAFALIQSVAWARGMQIPCGCFGPRHEGDISLFSLLRVYALLIASAIRNGLRLYSWRTLSVVESCDSDPRVSRDSDAQGQNCDRATSAILCLLFALSYSVGCSGTSHSSSLGGSRDERTLRAGTIRTWKGGQLDPGGLLKDTFLLRNTSDKRIKITSLAPRTSTPGGWHSGVGSSPKLAAVTLV